MKTYRITYTILHGKHEYTNETTVSAEDMTDKQAVCHLAELWLPDESPGYRAEFGQILLREDFGYLPSGTSAIKEVRWKEVMPVIIVTVRKGAIENIENIPENAWIEVRDWDNMRRDESGKHVPAVTLFASTGHTVPLKEIINILENR